MYVITFKLQMFRKSFKSFIEKKSHIVGPAHLITKEKRVLQILNLSLENVKTVSVNCFNNSGKLFLFCV